jgi:hypothetical protein
MTAASKTERQLIDSIRKAKTGADGEAERPTDAPTVAGSESKPSSSSAPTSSAPKSAATAAAAKPSGQTPAPSKPAARKKASGQRAPESSAMGIVGYSSPRRVWPD